MEKSNETFALNSKENANNLNWERGGTKMYGSGIINEGSSNPSLIIPVPAIMENDDQLNWKNESNAGVLESKNLFEQYRKTFDLFEEHPTPLKISNEVGGSTFEGEIYNSRNILENLDIRMQPTRHQTPLELVPLDGSRGNGTQDARLNTDNYEIQSLDISAPSTGGNLDYATLFAVGNTKNYSVPPCTVLHFNSQFVQPSNLPSIFILDNGIIPPPPAPPPPPPPPPAPILPPQQQLQQQEYFQNGISAYTFVPNTGPWSYDTRNMGQMYAYPCGKPLLELHGGKRQFPNANWPLPLVETFVPNSYTSDSVSLYTNHLEQAQGENCNGNITLAFGPGGAGAIHGTSGLHDLGGLSGAVGTAALGGINSTGVLGSFGGIDCTGALGGLGGLSGVGGVNGTGSLGGLGGSSALSSLGGINGTGGLGSLSGVGGIDGVGALGGFGGLSTLSGPVVPAPTGGLGSLGGVSGIDESGAFGGIGGSSSLSGPVVPAPTGGLDSLGGVSGLDESGAFGGIGGSSSLSGLVVPAPTGGLDSLGGVSGLDESGAFGGVGGSSALSGPVAPMPTGGLSGIDGNHDQFNLDTWQQQNKSTQITDQANAIIAESVNLPNVHLSDEEVSLGVSSSSSKHHKSSKDELIDVDLLDLEPIPSYTPDPPAPVPPVDIFEANNVTNGRCCFMCARVPNSPLHHCYNSHFLCNDCMKSFSKSSAKLPNDNVACPLCRVNLDNKSMAYDTTWNDIQFELTKNSQYCSKKVLFRTIIGHKQPECSMRPKNSLWNDFKFNDGTNLTNIGRMNPLCDFFDKGDIIFNYVELKPQYCTHIGLNKIYYKSNRFFRFHKYWEIKAYANYNTTRARRNSKTILQQNQRKLSFQLILETKTRTPIHIQFSAISGPLTSMTTTDKIYRYSFYNNSNASCLCEIPLIGSGASYRQIQSNSVYLNFWMTELQN